MSSIEIFLEFWHTKPSAPEYKIAEAYEKVKADLESKQSDLLRLIRPQRTSKGLIPVFLEGAENLVSEFEHAEKHLAEVRADIETYLKLCESQTSTNGLNDRLMRAKHAIAEASIEAKHAIVHAFHETDSLSQIEVMDDPKVQSALDNRDRIQSQLGPVVEDLQNRISKIKEILNKYNRIEI